MAAILAGGATAQQLSRVSPPGPVQDPEALRFVVEYPVLRSGSRWIRSDTELSGVFPIPLDALRSVLMDFSSYPRIFPRLAATSVLAEDERGFVIRQRYEIVILGFRFPTEYDLRILPSDDPGGNAWFLGWELVGSDGSVGGSLGFWELESVSGPGGESWTRVTHRNEGLVRKDYPIQERIMRSWGPSELSKSIVAVYREAYRRWSVSLLEQPGTVVR